MIVSGTGASLCLSGVEIEFVSAMNSTVFILGGGKVILEDVKINNQSNTNWVSPLVLSHSSISGVTVHLHSCTITNSNYKDTILGPW
jgi:hypothetical protein